MAAAFFLVLVLAWALVCLPAANRARERSPLPSTLLFKKGLELIGSEGHGHFVRKFGRLPVTPDNPRRTRVRWIPTFLLCSLVFGVLVTGVLAIARGGSIWELHLATDAALAIFVALLIEEKHRKLERRRKVRSLAVRRQTPVEEPAGLRLVAGAE